MACAVTREVLSDRNRSCRPTCCLLHLSLMTLHVCVQEHDALVRETFGEGAILDVIAGLQAECDNAGGLCGMLLHCRDTVIIIIMIMVTPGRGATWRGLRGSSSR